MTIFLTILLGVAGASVDQPLSTVRTRLHVSPQDPVFGAGSQLLLETKRYADRTVHVFSRATAPAAESRRVISASTAQRVEAEMSAWIKKVGASKGGLADLGCTRPLGTERARLRASMCLNGLSVADRRKFYDWFERTADLAR